MAGEKTERVMAALAGEGVDRVPVSAWWHDYKREWSAQDLAETTLEAYDRYGWDYVKVNPRFSYYAEDWGATYRRYDDRMPEIGERPVQSPGDLERITALDMTALAYAEQLEALRLIGRRLAGEAPFIQTVFSPLAVMTRITGSTKYVQKLMVEAPVELEGALEEIALTLSTYATSCLDMGASGIFYAAVEWGSSDFISWADYERFGKPYDLRVLEAVKSAPMNVLHVCRERNHLLRVLDYPVAAFHWDVHGAGNPHFGDVLSQTAKAVMGGVRVATLANGNYGDVMAEVNSAKAATDERRFLLAGGCSLDPATPDANLHALSGAVAR